jgi:hypothetical protein
MAGNSAKLIIDGLLVRRYGGYFFVRRDNDLNSVPSSSAFQKQFRSVRRHRRLAGFFETFEQEISNDSAPIV